MADKNMEAQITVEFEEATSRQSLNSGETINTLWSKVKRWLSDLKTVCFSGSYNDLSDKPTSLPANGGDADTVNGFGVAEYVATLPEGEYYTEAARINTRDKKIESCDTSNLKVGLADYATNADYAINSNTVNNHTVDSDVPANAVFTDTTNSDVTIVGNPVQLDGLQGGVPFSGMVVSGKNLISVAQAKVLGGNENSGYNVTDSPYSRTIIQKLQPNTTYTVKRYDSGNRFRIVLFSNEPSTAADTTAKQLVINSDGSITEYTFTTDTTNLWFAFTTHFAASGDAVEPIVQLEYGSTPTAYEPPITGRELTVNVSGKNLIPYPYAETTKTVNGITFTDNGDGTITANGTAVSNLVYDLSNFTYKKGVDYILSGCPNGGGNSTYKLKGSKVGLEDDIGNAKLIRVEEDVTSTLCILVYKGCTVENLVFRPQLELGIAATEYEPYHGSTTTITPDSNPYVIPNDIRQVEGLNNISVSEGELSVSGVRKNAAVKKIWDEMGMDLLFDGVTSADNPAVIDLANYKFVEIHHIMIANEKTYPTNIRLSLDSYLSSASTIITSIHGSSINTIHTEEGTVSSVYAISAAGSNMNNTKIYGIK